MNIFACHVDPRIAVLFILWWRHIVKMPLEAVQILYAAHHVCGGLPADAPDDAYKKTHAQHPCVRWAAASTDNYRWLVEHADALCDHYTEYLRRRLAEDVANNVPTSRRTKVREHACKAHVGWLREHVPACPLDGRTPFPVVIAPEELKRIGVYADGALDVHATYQRYVDTAVATERVARRKEAEKKKKIDGLSQRKPVRRPKKSSMQNKKV